MNDDRSIRFKLRVDKVDVPREDGDYWVDSAPNDNTYKLELVAEYTGNLLKEEVLKRMGFKGGDSILNPSCNNTELLEYINDVFKVAAQTVTFTLPSYYMVVDLESGAYCKTNVGHEVFNLKPMMQMAVFIVIFLRMTIRILKNLGPPRQMIMLME